MTQPLGRFVAEVQEASFGVSPGRKTPYIALDMIYPDPDDDNVRWPVTVNLWLTQKSKQRTLKTLKLHNYDPATMSLTDITGEKQIFKHKTFVVEVFNDPKYGIKADIPLENAAAQHDFSDEDINALLTADDADDDIPF